MVTPLESLKEKYMKENPDIITLDNYKEKK